MSQKLTILGGGESGIGAAILAQQKGFNVFLSDAGALKEKFRAEAETLAIPFEENGHSQDRILSSDVIVKSPGIPETAPIVVAAYAQGIEVISEIEFACRYTDATIVAITGSNGKTTTAMLVQHILQNAEKDAWLGGNIGRSVARELAERDHDYLVLEVSSFQLDGIKSFKPDVAILLNITPDHLDRYGNKFENYVAAKLRIAENQTPEDTLITNLDDEAITKTLKADSEVLGFTLDPEKFQPTPAPAVTAWTYDFQLNIKTINDNSPLTMNIQKLALQGKHNAYNSMAAGIAGRVLEIRKDIIRDSLSDFQNVEHRLERVASVCGIQFINDSKATNVNSTWYALESQQYPIVWIVGGVDKGNDYTQLMSMVREKVKAIICLGEDNSKLHDAFEGTVTDMYDVKSMAEAVGLAYQIGTKQDTVLLSPACASFDLFESYEDRGRQFKEYVRSL